jgi:hypothetical protein
VLQATAAKVIVDSTSPRQLSPLPSLYPSMCCNETPKAHLMKDFTTKSGFFALKV